MTMLMKMKITTTATMMMKMMMAITFLLGAPISLRRYSRENQIMQIVSVIASSGLSFERLIMMRVMIIMRIIMMMTIMMTMIMMMLMMINGDD